MSRVTGPAWMHAWTEFSKCGLILSLQGSGSKYTYIPEFPIVANLSPETTLEASALSFEKPWSPSNPKNYIEHYLYLKYQSSAKGFFFVVSALLTSSGKLIL